MDRDYCQSTYASPLGIYTLTTDREGLSLTGIWLEGQKYHGGGPDCENTARGTALLNRVKAWLDSYFEGKRPAIGSLPLEPIGSEFRRRVWAALLDIPYGGLSTYGEIARKLSAVPGASAASARAVGGAVGHNPISIIIPCHRVIGSDGSLTGYAGGLEAKLRLLKLEGADISGLPY
jgi:methylated-DNA-[protein]-cysteine S-methyltransferase